MGNLVVSDKYTIKIFLRFLRKHKCYNSYIFNVKQNRNVENVKDFLSYCRSRRFVRAAFRWSSSMEGHNYWNEISREWVKYAEKHNLQGIEDEFECY